MENWWMLHAPVLAIFIAANTFHLGWFVDNPFLVHLLRVVASPAIQAWAILFHVIIDESERLMSIFYN
jgi:hypothetical protein